jgi:hypothetical protein
MEVATSRRHAALRSAAAATGPLAVKYRTVLSLYRKPPSGETRLHDLESVAVDRLQVDLRGGGRRASLTHTSPPAPPRSCSA